METLQAHCRLNTKEHREPPTERDVPEIDERMAHVLDSHVEEIEAAKWPGTAKSPSSSVASVEENNAHVSTERDISQHG